MKNLIFILFILCSCASAIAQYAPQVGLSGCAALQNTDSVFVEWATQCSLQRGLMDIAQPAFGYASQGVAGDALGIADDITVSLGDSGVATLSFESPIFDAAGPDFAVFENGFMDGGNDSLAFLELGFVEVSSDSIHFIRFPATSLTQTNVQIGNDSYIFANQLNNLAGNYLTYYGTPFDLKELADSPNLDISNVRFVRIVDVIGNITNHATHDAAGRVINDPYPTPYPSGGFDLDAVGVIHQKVRAAVVEIGNDESVNIFPNPVNDKLNIECHKSNERVKITIMSEIWNVLQTQYLTQNHSELNMHPYPAGLYYLVIEDEKGERWVRKIVKE